MFSVSPLRSQATVCLINRDLLQLYHANRSVILVSSAINFSTDDGLDKFIAVIIAFHCLSFAQNGILDTLTTSNTKLVSKRDIPKEEKIVQEGSILKLTQKGSEEEIEVRLGDVISRDPAVVGRSTVVLKAKCDKWEGKNLVVKISWPGVGPEPEGKFLKKAMKDAKRTKGKWAMKHLPQVFYTMDVVFSEDLTFKSVEKLFKNAKFVDKGFVYKQRALRIITQEELYPLKSLVSVREMGQVFVGIA